MEKNQEELSQINSEYSALKDKYEKLNKKAKDNAKLERKLVMKMPNADHTKLFAEALLYGDAEEEEVPLITPQKLQYNQKVRESVEGVTFVDQPGESLNVQITKENEEENEGDESEQEEEKQALLGMSAVTDYVDPSDAKNFNQID